jgi:MoaA/NifB/PqqE/SkfB family radical SAM enzyme
MTNAPDHEGREVRVLRLHSPIPGVCDVSVTNVCNATCDFCSYAHDKGAIRERRWIDRTALARALPILFRRDIRYLTFQGGEPLLHPEIAGMVADARRAGMRPALITNGWLLPQKIEALADAGLGTLLVSIDSHSLPEHEINRGLKGLGERIRRGLAIARQCGITTLASVTVSRLVDYEALPDLLRRLGFDAVSFSYPRRERFGSSSLVYSEDSSLIAFDREELCAALDEIKVLRRRFPVMNPTASIEDVQRHIRGEEEVFACIGGHKYFYLDWNLDIWRCEAWDKPLGSVFDFDRIPPQRDRCTACIMSCYRNASVMMHSGIAAGDAARALAHGEIGRSLRLLFRRSVVLSVRAAAEMAPQIARLARRGGPGSRGRRGSASLAPEPGLKRAAEASPGAAPRRPTAE